MYLHLNHLALRLTYDLKKYLIDQEINLILEHQLSFLKSSMLINI